MFPLHHSVHLKSPNRSNRKKKLFPEKPWVKNEDTFIPVRKNQNASFWCTYDGTPVPQVEWLFNGYKINVCHATASNTETLMNYAFAVQ